MAKTLQDKLVAYAQLHYFHAEIRDEGDVAVFIDIAFEPLREVHVVHSFSELRAVLGY